MSWCEFFGAEQEPRLESLLGAVLEAHSKAALDNENMSTVAVRLVASSGRGFQDAMAAALMTLGNTHGPITAARYVLFGPEKTATTMVKAGVKVPGFGNSFYDSTDPAWEKVESLIAESFPESSRRLQRVSDVIEKAKGKRIAPNAAAFTAIAAQELGMVWGVESSMFVIGRVVSWARHYRAVKKTLE